MLGRKVWPYELDSHNNVSGKPGAVQMMTAVVLFTTCQAYHSVPDRSWLVDKSTLVT